MRLGLAMISAAAALALRRPAAVPRAAVLYLIIVYHSILYTISISWYSMVYHITV